MQLTAARLPLRAQFLSYKQLKKFLKQLPDTAAAGEHVGAANHAACCAPPRTAPCQLPGAHRLIESLLSAERAYVFPAGAEPPHDENGAPLRTADTVESLTLPERDFVRALNSVRSMPGIWWPCPLSGAMLASCTAQSLLSPQSAAACCAGAVPAPLRYF